MKVVTAPGLVGRGWKIIDIGPAQYCQLTLEGAPVSQLSLSSDHCHTRLEARVQEVWWVETGVVFCVV